MSLKLYGSPASTCTRKVLMTLAEKGVTDFEFQVIDFAKGEHKQQPHLSRQPFGQIPAIEHDGFSLYESRPIIRYLDEVLPGPKLTPAGAQDRARMEQWISVESANFTPHAMKIIYQAVFARWRGQEPIAANVEEGRAGAGRALDVMEAQLEETPFIAGDSFTLADVGFMPYLEYLEVGGHGDLAGSRPRVSAWWQQLRGRPTWQRVVG